MIASRSAPMLTIASTVFSKTPPSAPFQPAWAAPMTPLSPSQNRTGPQSAVKTPSITPGVAVTSASAFGRSPPYCPSTTTTSGEWT